MAIALRGTATTGSTTITAPTGVANGDLLIFTTIAASGTTITVPTGWTVVRNVTAGGGFSNIRLVVAYLAWTTGGATSWSLTGATYNVCAAYSGVSTGTPLVVENYTTASASTIATPTVNNTNSSGWRIAVWGANNGFNNSINGAWATFSPADTRRGASNSSSFAIALTDSNATVGTGNTTVTGTVPDAASSNGISAAWIGILNPSGVATPDTDTGTGADAATLALPNTETATGADTGAVTAKEFGTDTATGLDAAQITTPSMDGAVGAESAAVSSPTAETAAAADAAAVGQQGGDTAVGSEAATISVFVASPPDSGTASDSAQLIIAGTDSAAGSESAAVRASQPAADTGTGADAAVIALVMPTADSAAAADAAVVRVNITSADAAASTDAAAIHLAGSDTAAAADSAITRHAGRGVPQQLRLIKVIPRLPVWTGP
ncbi:hypothetical protein [Nocardia sp. NPDC046763]|uniref:hypothetical protein n=1 Tax=Nocardia sp. NPDC046763 TaxID=3155256 RepID=UPI0033DC8225